jgi:hypothetical protein
MNRLLQPALAVLIAFASAAGAQTLRVQVLDGKTGKPVANEHINLFANDDLGDTRGNRNGWGYNTDQSGIFVMSDLTPEIKSFTVYVDWHQPCAKVRQWFDPEKVLAAGVLSDNTCKPSFESKAAPGTLLLFVRPETFFEKMAH